jgi:hypothetical protein
VFNTASLKLITSIDVGAQVTGVMWSATKRELYATFGFTHAEVHTKAAIYSYPSLECLASLSMVSQYRALFSLLVPGRNEIIICASDETARIYSVSEKGQGRDRRSAGGSGGDADGEGRRLALIGRHLLR